MTELEISIDLDEHGRTQMYEVLCEKFGEDEVEQALRDQLIGHVTQMFDNRDRLEKVDDDDV